jgi:hypothetical protein
MTTDTITGAVSQLADPVNIFHPSQNIQPGSRG